ncbi:MAG: LPS export ABC transporter permease LptF [Deltaproteobacteria bacterium]|nr:LPS export ABC transporter permease LptF [Deltaproteobacteria bacterium]
MLKIINRYILKEISYPFFLIIFVLTFVLLMGKILQLMDLMVNKGVSFIDISKLFLLLTPSFLILTIPISLLISILIGLGRLSSDNEITILKVSGISLYRLIAPIAFATFIAFILTAVTSIFLVPHSKYESKKLLFTIAKKKASIGIKEKVFNDDFKGILLYAENIPVHGDYMEGVIISDSRMMKEPSTIVAKKAYLVSDPHMMTVTLRLENGSTHSVDTKLKNYRKMDFSTYDINLDIESSLAEEKKVVIKKSSEMTLWEITENIKKAGLEERFLRELSIEFNKTIATPFACIVFGILGIPLGIRSHRAVKARGFTIGIFIVFTYYIIRLGGEALADTGRLSPLIGTWAPNIIFCMAGIYLLVMAAKDRPLTIHTMWAFLKKLVGKEKGR